MDSEVDVNTPVEIDTEPLDGLEEVEDERVEKSLLNTFPFNQDNNHHHDDDNDFERFGLIRLCFLSQVAPQA